MPRPTKYDIDTVLENAMLAFWQHGYEATSLKILTTVTGLGKGSLYNIFTDKRTLYKRALMFYAQREVCGAVALLQQGDSLKAQFKLLLDSIIQRVQTQDRSGCLLCNASTDIGLVDEEIAGIVRDSFMPLQRELERLLQQHNVLPNVAEAQAQQLIAVYTGLQVMMRGGYKVSVLENIIAQTILHLPSK